MLQQTQTTTVIPYFARFVQSLPTVQALAAADESKVLKLWEGLGYYRRARQLHAAAKLIVKQHGGDFPESYDEVVALPGVGRYTAGAVLSIGRDQRLPILEANTIRLFARLIGLQIETTRSPAQKQLWAFAEEILPFKNVGDFNQSLMEIGSSVCKPQSPRCDVCPLSEFCVAFANNIQHEIPVARKKSAAQKRQEAAVVVQSQGRFLVRKRTADEWWTGLWDFPRFVAKSTEAKTIAERVLSATGVEVESCELFRTIHHGVTKYQIELHCYHANRMGGRIKSRSGYRWVTRNQLHELPLTRTAREMANCIDAKPQR